MVDNDSKIPAIGTLALSNTLPPLTRATLALYAGASNDHTPVHIDSDAAREAGLPDVIAQGMCVMGLLGRTLTSVFPQDRLRQFKARFVAHTNIHDRLTCRGTVAQHLEDGSFILELVVANQEDVVKLRGEAIVASTNSSKT